MVVEHIVGKLPRRLTRTRLAPLGIGSSHRLRLLDPPGSVGLLGSHPLGARLKPRGLAEPVSLDRHLLCPTRRGLLCQLRVALRSHRLVHAILGQLPYCALSLVGKLDLPRRLVALRGGEGNGVRIRLCHGVEAHFRLV